MSFLIIFPLIPESLWATVWLLQAHAVRQQFCYKSQIGRKMSQINRTRKKCSQTGTQTLDPSLIGRVLPWMCYPSCIHIVLKPVRVYTKVDFSKMVAYGEILHLFTRFRCYFTSDFVWNLEIIVLSFSLIGREVQIYNIAESSFSRTLAPETHSSFIWFNVFIFIRWQCGKICFFIHLSGIITPVENLWNQLVCCAIQERPLFCDDKSLLNSSRKCY